MPDDLNNRVLLSFAELEFILGQEAGWPRMRAQLNGNPPDAPQVLQAGAE